MEKNSEDRIAELQGEATEEPSRALEPGDILPSLEALLFAAGDGAPTKKICEILGVKEKALMGAVKLYNERECTGLEIVKSEKLLRLSTKREHSEIIEQFFNTKAQGLSKAALEVLAIIALRQPVTRAEIEEMRGVSSDSIVNNLLKRELIYCSGQLDKIGKPMLYSTTEKFLEVFSLESLDQLPKLDELLLL